MGRKKQISGYVLSIRTSVESSARLDALVAKYPLLNKHAIARVALKYGLDAIEKDSKWFEKSGDE